MDKRYIVTLDMYVHARDDKHAISKAKMIANRQAHQYGNRCNVVEVVENPFGCPTTRTVFTIKD